MKRLCILTQNHISKNPRVLKESILLASIGYEVKILTTWHSSEALQLDRQILKSYPIQYETYSDLRQGNLRGRYHRIRFQISRRLNALGIESIDAGGYGPWSLLDKALKEKSELYIIHQEIPTLISNKLVKAGLQVAYDFEDWYSRDLTLNAQKFRPVKLLAEAEHFAIKNGLWCTTTSKSLAKELASESGHLPEVIYNGFSLKERENIQPEIGNIQASQTLKLAWISQTIGPGRGLEEFIHTIIHFNHSIELHLAGAPRNEFIEVLRKTIEHYPRLSLVIHPPMAPAAIVPWLNTFDGGIASDIPNSPSRDYTVTNKILHYLLAGIPVIASPTKGHQEIAQECPESVCIMNDTNNLNQFLISISPESPERQKIREKTWKDGIAFSWEVQADKLLKLITEKLN